MNLSLSSSLITRSFQAGLFARLLLLGSLTAQAQTTRYVSTTGINTDPASATSWATSTTDLQGAITDCKQAGVGW